MSTIPIVLQEHALIFPLKWISGGTEMANHLSQPCIASGILWKQKKGSVLRAYDTEAICQIISPAVEQIAALISKLPNAYLN